jgi:hypothetical protein
MNSAPAEAAAKNARLFVSEPDNGFVAVYDVPSMNLVTILQTFNRPQGECADNDGDVWVVDAGDKKIDELDYAGKMVAQLQDKSGTPYSCAWDATTGDLAVTNSPAKDDTGAVLVYRHGAGSPMFIRNLDLNSYDFAGYNLAGDLYFDGATAGGKFVLSEVQAHKRYARTIAVYGVKIYSPGFVQWNSQSRVLDVGDQNCERSKTTCIYEMRTVGGIARAVYETSLQTYRGSKVCDVIQAALYRGDVYGSDDEHCGYAQNATYRWRYPRGGHPEQYTGKTSASRFGAAVATETSP